MAGTFADSWRITKRSFALIGETPGMLVFPLVAGITVIAAFLLFVAGTYWLPPLLFPPGNIVTGQEVVGLVLFVLAYFVANIASVYATAALTGVATLRLNGQPATTADGWRIARTNLRRLLLWAILAATIGLAIQLVSSRFKGAAGLVIRVAAGASWSIVTYFMIPVLLYEREGAWASLKRSAGLFVNNFGRTIVSNFVVGLIVGAGIVLAVVLLFFGVFALVGGSLLLGLLIVAAALSVVVVLALIGAAVEGIVRAALYRYVTTGQIDPNLIPSDYSGRGPRPLP